MFSSSPFQNYFYANIAYIRSSRKSRCFTACARNCLASMFSCIVNVMQIFQVNREKGYCIHRLWYWFPILPHRTLKSGLTCLGEESSVRPTRDMRSSLRNILVSDFKRKQTVEVGSYNEIEFNYTGKPRNHDLNYIYHKQPGY